MTDFSLSKINEKIVKDSKFIPKLKESISQVIVGQNELIDKILIQSVLILLCVSSWTSSLVPYWAVILIICRETLITGLRGYAEVQQIDFSASKLGKGKTMSQTIAIVMILAGMAIHGVSMQEMLYSEICYWAMMIATTLTVISGIDYAIKLRSAMS